MRPFRLYLVITTIFIATAFSQEKKFNRLAADDRGEAEALQEIRSARGVDHWTPNDVLMGLTRPPYHPVHSIAEWEKAGAVVFALDSDLSNSFLLNRKIKTTNSPEKVYSRDARVVAALNNLYCQADDDDDSDLSLGANASERKDSAQCTNGALNQDFLEQSFERLEMGHDFLATVSRLSRYLEVVLLVNSAGSDELEVTRMVQRMRTFDAAKDVLISPHVLFMQAQFDTKWIRDYGPLFVRDSEGSIICVDTRYDLPSTSQDEMIKRLLTRAKQAHEAQGNDRDRTDASDSDTGNEASRLHDDEAPSILAARLRQTNGGSINSHPVSVVRPPIALSGGDFLTDGQGVAFTSTRTLRENGGNVEMLDLNFKRYLGIDHLVYLHPLPGETIKHIDMFLQIASPNVILLGKFSAGAGSAAEQRLQSTATAALEDNLNIIRSYYEHMGRKVNVIDSDRIDLTDAP